MQRVATCLYRRNDQVLLLQKPRRGWWTCPGGKMEPAETVIDTVHREYKEETGLELISPQLRGVFTMVMEEEGMFQHEWMLFLFLAQEAAGEMLVHSQEGLLQWHPISMLDQLPMPEGDRLFIQQVLNHDRLLVGRFHYTPDFQLLDYHLHDTQERLCTSS